MLAQFTEIQICNPDEDLRYRVNDHFIRQINERTKANERKEAALRTLAAHLEVLDTYISMKEKDAPEAHAQSDIKIQLTQAQFVVRVQKLARQLLELRKQSPLMDGDVSHDAFEETRRRAAFLKHIIEDNDG